MTVMITDDMLALAEAAIEDDCTFANVVREFRYEYHKFSLRDAALYAEASLKILAERGNKEALQALSSWKRIHN